MVIRHPVRSVKDLYETYVGQKGMMTVLDYRPSKGRAGSPGIEVPVNILDAKVQYGREFLLISPLQGIGSGWSRADKVNVVDEWPHESTEIEPQFEPDEPRGIDPDGADAFAT